MLLNESTKLTQEKLADYCRTGEFTPLEGLTENRVHHYRRLIFNIALDTLSTGFPIASKLLGEQIWNDLVKAFYGSEVCTSPYVWKMPMQFYEYSKTSKAFQQAKEKHPFLDELLHFELIELEMYMMEDLEVEKASISGNMLTDQLVLHPESKIIMLEYPVHFKPPAEIRTEDKGQYYCLCFREPDQRKILFFDLSPLFAFVIEQIFLGNNLQYILQSASESLNIDYKILEHNTIEFLNNLDNHKFIVGYQ